MDDKALLTISLLSNKATPLKELIIGRMGDCIGTRLITACSKKFEVPEHVVEFGFIKRPDLFGVSKDREPTYFTKDMQVTVKTGEIYIRVLPNTRLDDIEAIWSLINKEQQKLSGYTSQSKAAYEPSLMYAIYKQRLPNKDGKRKSFDMIFRMYEQGKLPNYKGSTSLNSSDSLERHYRRHMPKPDSM